MLITLRRTLMALCVMALVCGANFLLWAWCQQPSHPYDSNGQFAGMAFSPFRRNQSPLVNDMPSQTDIASDMALISRYTRRIRLYASVGYAPAVQEAARHGLDVMGCAWLDRRLDNNDVEIAALIKLAHEHPNMSRAVVGSESIWRGNLSPEQLMSYLDRVRAQTHIPISTAEPWHIWLKYPQLVKHVDFITIHVLPYWEGEVPTKSIATFFYDYQWIRYRFPNKHVVVGEVGWPSAGERVRYAKATLSNEADFIRDFLHLAVQRNIDYYVMEAFDQPWKNSTEGEVGAYWGIFNSNRQLKFPFSGPVKPDPTWVPKAITASTLGLLPIFLFVMFFSNLRFWGRLVYACMIQASATVLVWSIALPFDYYLSHLDWSMLLLLLVAQLTMVSVLLVQGFEFIETLSLRKWQRHFSRAAPANGMQPFVSIHVACHNEPPEMVIETLDSLAALNYAHFEVLVIDNNTKDPTIWLPLQNHCAALGERFRFFHLEDWPGYKAGALNFALDQTDTRAEVVAIVDSDYVVDREWLPAMLGHFAQENVGIVQGPQAHREFGDNPFRRMCNWEYEGFFRIGMHHRNERDAIIQHGTMTMIRHTLLRHLRWAEWCICEDAELGLRVIQAGYTTVYVDEILGRGITPADFTAYKTQRFRWACGAMQILRKHARPLIRGKSLTAGQRFHFLTGWSPWFADALHLIFSMLSIVWTAAMLALPGICNLPHILFLLPVVGYFTIKVVFSLILYRARVDCSWRETLAAATASMALTHAIALGILNGMFRRGHAFRRTAKAARRGSALNVMSAVNSELLLSAGLVMSAIATLFYSPAIGLEVQIWFAVLLIQAIPYAAAVHCAWKSSRPIRRHALLTTSRSDVEYEVP